MTRLALLLLLAAAPVAAQHSHTVPASTGPAVSGPPTATHVTGLRVDDAAPPAGSAVGRTSLRWPDGGYATIVYGRPYRRGRVVFGGIVGYGEPWVAGAHQSTELWTSVPLAVGGVRLAPGGYTLFVTPRAEGRWTLHVHRALGMHLADEYDASRDVAVLSLAPETTPAPVEALTWAFETAPDGTASLALAWDTVRLAVAVAR